MKKLLEIRKESKKKKPVFTRSDSNRKKFDSWRKPRGMHNKLRLHKKGHKNIPSIGFSSPKEVRGYSKDGFVTVLVSNIKDLNSVDKNKNILIISKNMGIKKRLEVIKKAIELGYKIENIKEPNKWIEEKIKESNIKKEKKKGKLETKKEKKKELEKKAEEKKDQKDETKQKEVEEKIKEDIKKSSPK